MVILCCFWGPFSRGHVYLGIKQTRPETQGMRLGIKAQTSALAPNLLMVPFDVKAGSRRCLIDMWEHHLQLWSAVYDYLWVLLSADRSPSSTHLIILLSMIKILSTQCFVWAIQRLEGENLQRDSSLVGNPKISVAIPCWVGGVQWAFVITEMAPHSKLWVTPWEQVSA